MKTDTIVAIATAMNSAGISIVRMSGSEALNVIDRIYVSRNGEKKLSEVDSHTVHYGYIMDGDKTIDEVMVLVMKGPNSYTREDIVEIDCHGGVVVTKKILETVVKYGARVADPGEFTKRAFLNGRIDLSQAEAVIDVINAKNEFALSSSVNQLKGSILNKIRDVRELVLRDIAFIEAALDDPEHMTFDNFSEELLKRVNGPVRDLEYLLKSSDNGRILKEGIKTVIIGKPNVGKSSLLNVLVGEDRAIVTDIAGTTRDTLEESININGIFLNIIDTAGIRDTEDVVEKIGVEKARKSAMEADLVIYVADATAELDKNDVEIIDMVKDKKVIILLNKSDLKPVVTAYDLEKFVNRSVIAVSAKENTGLGEFEDCLKSMFFSGEITFNDEIYVTNVRHKTAIQESIDSLRMVVRSVEDGMPEDFYSIDLMSAYETLGSIIGESVGEDLVNMIFSEFCMGK